MVGGVRLGWPASASLLTGFMASLLVHLLSIPLSGEDLRVRGAHAKERAWGLTLSTPSGQSAVQDVALWPSPDSLPIGW